MLRRFRCARGHEWRESPPGSAAIDATCCPVCGQSAETVGVQEDQPTVSLGDNRAAQAATGPLEDKLPGYELIGELGRGGMGVVYQARHVALNRVVAVKVLLTGPYAGLNERARFHAEAQAAAHLRHPNIVTIHEVGDFQGRPYFSMDYIVGQSLAELARRQPLAANAAADCVRKVALAIQFAHDNGIVHRDLKPANILIDAAGEPHVSDFGLAKQVEASSELTATGTALGTPSYMPPEQATGRHDLIGPASDVYALGATLYDLLVGRPPFRAETPVDTLRQVIDGQLAPPRLLNPQVPRDLETICLKCLEKDPPRRYASAQALADDLERFLDGRPILARPVSPAETAWRWARRHPTRAGLLAASAVALAALVALGVGLRYQSRLAVANRRLETANQQLGSVNVQLQATQKDLEGTNDRLVKAHDEQEQTLCFRRVATALSAWHDNEVPLAVQRLSECAASRRQWEWRYVDRLCRGNLHTLGHVQELMAVAYSADGERLAAVSRGGVLKVWNAAGELRLTLTTDKIMTWAVAFSPDGGRIATGGSDNIVKLWDADTGKPVLTLQGHTRPITCLAFSPEGRRLVSGGEDKALKLWDLQAGREERTTKLLAQPSSVAFSPKGDKIALVAQSARVYDSASGQVVLRLQGHSTLTQAIAFSPDGSRIATTSRDKTIKLWDAQTGQETLTLSGHSDSVWDVAFSPDGRRLASASWDRSVKIWDLASGREIVSLRGHTAEVVSVAFHADGQRVASGSRDTTVKVWDLRHSQEALTLLSDEEGTLAIAWSPDGQRLATGGYDDTVRICDATSGQTLATLKGHAGLVHGVAFSPDGSKVASASYDRTARVWDIDGGAALLTLQGHAGFVMAIAYTTDGKQIATAGADGTVRLWDAESGRQRHLLSGHTQTVWALAVSPDGQRIATSGDDGTVRLWDAVRGVSLGTVGRPSPPGYRALAFSPDGKRLAMEGRIYTLEGALPNPNQYLQGHTRPIRAVAFSPDGKRIATGSEDRTVRLWDAVSGQEALMLKGHREAVTAVAFSRDGTRLATASDDGTARVWNAIPVQPEKTNRPAE